MVLTTSQYSSSMCGLCCRAATTCCCSAAKSASGSSGKAPPLPSCTSPNDDPTWLSALLSSASQIATTASCCSTCGEMCVWRGGGGSGGWECGVGWAPQQDSGKCEPRRSSRLVAAGCMPGRQRSPGKQAAQGKPQGPSARAQVQAWALRHGKESWPCYRRASYAACHPWKAQGATRATQGFPTCSLAMRRACACATRTRLSSMRTVVRQPCRASCCRRSW